MNRNCAAALRHFTVGCCAIYLHCYIAALFVRVRSLLSSFAPNLLTPASNGQTTVRVGKGVMFTQVRAQSGSRQLPVHSVCAQRLMREGALHTATVHFSHCAYPLCNDENPITTAPWAPPHIEPHRLRAGAV